MWTQLAAWQKALIVVLVIVGVLAIAAGVVYIALPAHSLPTFFPAYAARGHKHATKHGVAAIVLGVVLIVLAWIVQVSARRSRSW
jgi:hypothetical protein